MMKKFLEKWNNLSFLLKIISVCGTVILIIFICGEILLYNNRNESKLTVTEREADLKRVQNNNEEIIKKNLAKNIVKEGDYIEYSVPERTFEITAEESGEDTVQSYNTLDYIGTWQVLYNNEKYGLQIVSSNAVAKLALKGMNGYNNSIDILNKISSYYVNSDYGISGRSIGTNPINFDDKSGYQDFTEMSYSTTDLDFITYYIDFTRYNGIYRSVTDTDYKIDRNQLLVLGIGPGEIDDWLASRYITKNIGLSLKIRTDNRLLTVLEEKNYWNYESMIYLKCNYYYQQLYSTPTEAAISSEPTYEYTVEENGGERGVKPVITLKEKLIITGGNGTIENPYKIKNEDC